MGLPASKEKISRRNQLAVAVQEAMEGFLAPRIGREILRQALDTCGFEDVPEVPEEAAAFVRGPLHTELERAAGRDCADSVSARVEPVLFLAQSAVAPTKQALRPEASSSIGVSLNRSGVRPASRPSRIDEGLRPVFVVSLDRAGVQTVARGLAAEATVTGITDIFELLSALDAHAHAHPVVVLDCCVPAVDARMLASMVPIMPDGFQIVLWGATERLMDHVRKVSCNPSAWLTCSVNATKDDIVGLVRSLIETEG